MRMGDIKVRISKREHQRLQTLSISFADVEALAQPFQLFLVAQIILRTTILVSAHTTSLSLFFVPPFTCNTHLLLSTFPRTPLLAAKLKQSFYIYLHCSIDQLIRTSFFPYLSFQYLSSRPRWRSHFMLRQMQQAPSSTFLVDLTSTSKTFTLPPTFRTCLLRISFRIFQFMFVLMFPISLHQQYLTLRLEHLLKPYRLQTTWVPPV